jgi:hypothetical protein
VFDSISASGWSSSVVSMGGMNNLIKECSFISCTAQTYGVLWADSGIDLTIETCCATECGGVKGGFVAGTGAEVKVNRSTLLKIDTDQEGGMYIQGAKLTVGQTNFTEMQARKGACIISTGIVKIEECTVFRCKVNYVVDGGLIRSVTSSIEIWQSNLVDNLLGDGMVNNSVLFLENVNMVVSFCIMKGNEISEFGRVGTATFTVTGCAIDSGLPDDISAFTLGTDTSQWGRPDPMAHSLAHLMMENCYPQIVTSPYSIPYESPSPSGSPETPKKNNTAAIVGGSVGGAAAVGGGAAALFVLRRKFGGNKVANNLDNNLDIDGDVDDDSSDTQDDFVVSDDE